MSRNKCFKHSQVWMLKPSLWYSGVLLRNWTNRKLASAIVHLCRKVIMHECPCINVLSIAMIECWNWTKECTSLDNLEAIKPMKWIMPSRQCTLPLPCCRGHGTWPWGYGCYGNWPWGCRKKYKDRCSGMVMGKLKPMENLYLPFCIFKCRKVIMHECPCINV